MPSERRLTTKQERDTSACMHGKEAFAFTCSWRGRPSASVAGGHLSMRTSAPATGPPGTGDAMWLRFPFLTPPPASPRAFRLPLVSVYHHNDNLLQKPHYLTSILSSANSKGALKLNSRATKDVE